MNFYKLKKGKSISFDALAPIVEANTPTPTTSSISVSSMHVYFADQIDVYDDLSDDDDNQNFRNPPSRLRRILCTICLWSLYIVVGMFCSVVLVGCIIVLSENTESGTYGNQTHGNQNNAVHLHPLSRLNPMYPVNSMYPMYPKNPKNPKNLKNNAYKPWIS